MPLYYFPVILAQLINTSLRLNRQWSLKGATPQVRRAEKSSWKHELVHGRAGRAARRLMKGGRCLRRLGITMPCNSRLHAHVCFIHPLLYFPEG